MKKIIILFFAGSAIIITSAFSLKHSNSLKHESLTMHTSSFKHNSGVTYCTGSPFDGSTCSGCHNGGATTPTATITAVPAFGTGNTYTPGTAYVVSVNCSGSYPDYGFDLEILNSTSSTSALDAGTCGTVVTSNCKKMTSSGQPTNYVQTSRSGTANAATFSFNWTAPSSGSAYIYCTVLGVNANGSTSGDKVVAITKTLTPGSAPLAVTITNTVNVKCNGGSTGTATATATGGTTPYTYSWNTSPVQTTQTATGLAVGSYTVTVNGTATATVTITQPTALATNIVAVAASTCTSSDGTLTATASGGTSPYTYSWSNSHTTAAITGLAPGTYTLTVTDVNLCTKVTTAVVGCNGSTLAVTITNTVNVKCFGGSTGTATATATGGTTPYTYSWNTTPVQTTQTATGLAVGNYTVTVNGTGVATVSITQPTAITTIINATSASSCTSSDGSITASPSGGTSPYTYAWSNGHTTAAITGLAAGSYTLTVTDANLCTKITVATVTCGGGGGSADAGIANVPTPADTICSHTFTPTVNLKCFGTSILTSCKILYHVDSNPDQTYNWSGSLSTGASVDVTLPSVTVPVGAHTFTSTSNSPNAITDVNPANDQYQRLFFVKGSSLSLPILEGFESSASLPTDWKIWNPDNDAAWQVVTTVAHTGNNCVGFNNCDGNGSGSNMTGTKDRFITPAYNLSTATTSSSLAFDVAYTVLNYKGQVNADTLVVYCSTDCGSTWNQIYLKGGYALASTTNTAVDCWTPAYNEWRTDVVVLGNLAAGQPSVMFAFENRSDWGEWLYIDNINVSATLINGIESINPLEGFSIYPNPATTSFTIEGTSNSEKIHYEIYNVVGAAVKTGDVAAKTTNFNGRISISDISKGMYFVKISDGKNEWTKKLIVQD